jgi:hypothetical protein
MAKTIADMDESLQKLIAAGDLGGAVVEYVRQYDWVTFHELARLLEPHMPVSGNQALSLPDDDNILLWVEMSEEFASLVLDLLKNRRIFAHPAQTLTYLIDGGVLKLPPAYRRVKGGYKKPHWFPICFRTVSLEDEPRKPRPKERFTEKQIEENDPKHYADLLDTE